MAALWVMPSIDQGRGDDCLATLVGRRVVRVVNYPPHPNRGVSAAWNEGRARVLDEGLDWLVVVSEAMRFGPTHGADFEDALAGAWCDSLFGWHLIGLAALTLADVGPFDEQFAPAYFEDSDYLWRLHLAGYPSPRANTRPFCRIEGIDATDLGHAHAVRTGAVSIPWATLTARYLDKWGGVGGEETYLTPYDDPTRTYRDVGR